MAESVNTDIIWGAKEIGAAIGLTERQATHWLQQGELPGRRIGKGAKGRWCASRKALLAYLAGQGAPTDEGETA